MNTAQTIYPNNPLDIDINSQTYCITWIPESDEIVISTAEAGKKKTLRPDKINLVSEDGGPKTESTYSVNFEAEVFGRTQGLKYQNAVIRAIK